MWRFLILFLILISDSDSKKVMNAYFEFAVENQTIKKSVSLPFYGSSKHFCIEAMREQGVMEDTLCTYLPDVIDRFNKFLQKENETIQMDEFELTETALSLLEKPFTKLNNRKSLAELYSSGNGLNLDKRLQFSLAYSEILEKASTEMHKTLLMVESDYKEQLLAFKLEFQKRHDVIAADLQKLKSKEDKKGKSKKFDSYNLIDCDDVTAVATNLENVKTDYKNKMLQKKEEQKNSYIKWLLELYDCWKHASEDPEKKRQLDFNIKIYATFEEKVIEYEMAQETTPIFVDEEKFTINLGRQNNSIFNISICRVNEAAYFEPIDLNKLNALYHIYKLYSTKITCSIVVVNSRIPSDVPNYRRNIFKTAECSTEFHFDVLIKQLRRVAKIFKYNSTTKTTALEMGDVYCTLHSNFANIHVIYHIVLDTEDEVFSSNKFSLNHPFMLGMKNIISSIFKHGAEYVDIPLFMCGEHEQPYTNEDWYFKRAELILKIVKGYLIQLCMWENDIHNISFRYLMPADTPVEICKRVKATIPSIYTIKDTLKF